MAGKKSSAVSEEKDPAVVALIAVVGLLLIQAPAIGYIYLGKVKKGLVYLVALWLSWAVVTGIYILLSFTIIGAFVCIPIFVLPFILGLIMVWDVYMDAQGKKLVFPDIKE